MFTLRKRLALALCRAAGLTEVASTRAEMDDMRAEQRKAAKARAAELALVKAIAEQTNANTFMLKRWLDGSPALQTIEKNVQRKASRKIILPPHADLRLGATAEPIPGTLTIASK